MKNLFRRPASEFQKNEQPINNALVPFGVEIRRELLAKGEAVVGTEADWAAATQEAYDHDLALTRAETSLRRVLAEEGVILPPDAPLN